MTDATIGTSVATVPASATPDLIVIDGKVTTSSLQIAEHFGKRHTHVIRAIRNLLTDLSPEGEPKNGLSEFAQLNFGLSEFVDSTGRHLPMYRITRDGFTLLAMGFTGKEALQWKLAYIDAFNKMEAELTSRALPYTVQPTDKLSAEQQGVLRDLLTSHVKRLPIQKQGGAMVQGWSKLKAHFGVSYRDIPAAEFTEAVSIVSRHVTEWELIESSSYQSSETVNDLVKRLAEQLDAPNGYSVYTFMPLWHVINKKIAGVIR